MANNTATLKKPSETFKPAPNSVVGRVFSISLKGIPRVNAETRARLEAAARVPNSKRRSYPQLGTE
jgi:hypothetical protein